MAAGSTVQSWSRGAGRGGRAPLPPVGGQGLNLCWRDVETLMSIADPGLDARSIARRYGRRRWVDVIAVGVATDLLVRLFSNRIAPLCQLRRIALVAMARMSPLRRLSLRAMTDGPLQLLRPCQSEGNGRSLRGSQQPPPTGSFSSVAGFSATKAWLEQKRHQSGSSSVRTGTAPLPVVLWSFGLLSLEQLQQVLDWQNAQE